MLRGNRLHGGLLQGRSTKYVCINESSNHLAEQGIRQKFVDAFGNLAVEKCLLQPMSLVFASQTENFLDDSLVSNIAAENESSRHTTDVTTAAP